MFDLQERNANTRKLSSPLPDIDGILRRVARKKYRSIIDGQDAYEQICVVPEHINRTTVTTPDGNMVSTVLQQGDCNAPATYQALMNHLFGEFIGRWMDVYLDDIIIYSDSLAEHMDHVKTVLRILEREKLYLSEGKLQFLCKELKILGRVVNDEGIRMDPAKVDKILAWKTPVNRDALRSFLGAVGFLADDIHKVHVPMGTLAEVTGDTVPFRWDFTQQRACSVGLQCRCRPHLVNVRCEWQGHSLRYRPRAGLENGEGGSILQCQTQPRTAKLSCARAGDVGWG